MSANNTSSAGGGRASPEPTGPATASPQARDHARDIVVIGASAGGVEALKAVVGALPADYAGSVFVVLHIPPSVTSVLASILGRVAQVPCVSATDGAPIEPGMVYVAPPNRHLLLEPGYVRLVPGPRENGHRPAVDPLFRSAAAAYGPRVVGVVLTGNLDDGTRGLLVIEHQGGVAVVQDPGDADFAGMPQSAIANVPVHYVLRADAIGAQLAALALPSSTSSPRERDSRDSTMPDDSRALTAGDGTAANGAASTGAATDGAAEHAADLATGIGVVNRGARINEALGGIVSAFTCPECHGTLWELHDGALLRYRCRVGHSYTDQGLVDNKARAVEDALWTALTALEESAAIAGRVADRAVEHGRSHSAEMFRERAEFLERRGAVLRDVLNGLPGHVDAI